MEQAEEGGGHSSAAGGDLRESHQTHSLGSQEGDQSQNQSNEEEGKMVGEGGRECVQGGRKGGREGGREGGMDTCSKLAGPSSVLIILLGKEGIIELAIQSENCRDPSQD